MESVVPGTRSGVLPLGCDLTDDSARAARAVIADVERNAGTCVRREYALKIVCEDKKISFQMSDFIIIVSIFKLGKH